jgi:transcriptional regulator with XRE-family HTH domain
MAGKRKARGAAAGVSPEQVAIEKRLREALPRVIQREREAAGMTQEQLAEKAGVHFTTVGKIERGKQIPSVALLTVVAKALEMSLADLLGKALPEAVPAPNADEDDATVQFVKALPKPDRRDLLPLLEALQRWKAGR